MKWAWKVGRLTGIEVRIHATFLLILVWAAVSFWIPERSLLAGFVGVCFVLAIFGCVVLHELGHALMARRYGIRTRDITLLPIGGVARLERMPDDPKQEIWVALAGPAVNVAIAGIIFMALLLTSAWEPLGSLDLWAQGSLFKQLMIVNLFLVVFNLLPAFPMDGGRILRGLLAIQMNYARATRIAANVGQTMALLFGLLGLFVFHNPFLVFIAVFVWIGAAQEANFAEMRSVLQGVRVENAMLTDYQTLMPTDSLARVVDLMLARSQQDFPVVEDGHIVGILTRNDLVMALAKFGQGAQVGEVMQREFRAVDASDMLEAVFPRLQSPDCKIMPVTRFGELVGLITLENVGEFVMIRSAMDEAKRAA